MYRETIEEFENININNYLDYIDKSDLIDYIKDDIDNWIEDAIVCDIESGHIKDLLSDYPDKFKSITFLITLLNDNTNNTNNINNSDNNQDNKKLIKFLKDNENYKKQVLENFDDYNIDLDLIENYLPEYLDENKDEILDIIEDSISADRDSYGYNGVSRSDFF